MRKRDWLRSTSYTSAIFAALMAWGCRNTHKDVSFLGEADHNYYRSHATAIEHPDIVTPTPAAVRDSLPPRTLESREHCEIRDLPLTEAVYIGMTNSEIVKSGGQFLSPANPLLNNAERVTSSFDSAIQESGVLFGGRGVEAALSDFDAQFNASVIAGRNDVPSNSALLPPVNVAETGAFSASLGKTFANGGKATITHDVNYLSSNQPGLNFPSAYSGNARLGYQLPLLAGAGTEFTRVAGPITNSFGGITGVSQGVVISRINNDLVLCDYENALRNLTKDIEDAYWNLHLAYQLFDTAAQVHEDTLGIWRFYNTLWKVDEERDSGDRAQAQDQLFQTKGLVDAARSNIYTRETELRRLLGMPVNDGTVLRPSEEPTTAQFDPDWHYSVSEALTHRVELRKQKWTIRSLDLQLHAARSLTRPRLDAVAGYQVNSLGDDLLSYGSGNSFYQGLSGANNDGWSAGVVMNMPVGLRSAHAQVQNYELRLAKANKALEFSEEEIAQELAVAFQEISRTYAVLQSNHNRYLAAMEFLRVKQVREDAGQDTADVKLRGLIRRAEAQRAYHESLIDYNKSITNLHYRKGTILAYNNIQMSEGGWSPSAYQDADRLNGRRAHGHEIDVEAEPTEFVSPVAPGHVDFTTYAAEPTPTDAAPSMGAAEYNPPADSE